MSMTRQETTRIRMQASPSPCGSRPGVRASLPSSSMDNMDVRAPFDTTASSSPVTAHLIPPPVLRSAQPLFEHPARFQVQVQVQHAQPSELQQQPQPPDTPRPAATRPNRSCSSPQRVLQSPKERVGVSPRPAPALQNARRGPERTGGAGCELPTLKES